MQDQRYSPREIRATILSVIDGLLMDRERNGNGLVMTVNGPVSASVLRHLVIRERNALADDLLVGDAETV